MPALDVLFEDNHLLVINKPAELATMGALPGMPSAVQAAAHYLKHKYHKPGNVFVGVVSRLDACTSGALVLARTSKAASRLSEQIRQHDVSKRYLALVAGRCEFYETTQLEDWLRKDDVAHRMRVVAASAKDAQRALLRLQSLRYLSSGPAAQGAGTRTLLAIELLTGRKHQIRVQLAHRGFPVIGDTKYGSQSRFPRGIALHCERLVFKHPTLDQMLAFEAPVPRYWSIG